MTTKDKEFKEMIDKIVNDALMYADMDEDEFWVTSTISPQEAESRYKHYEEFRKEILNKLDKKTK